MSDDAFWTRGKLVAGAVVAIVAAAGTVLSQCRGAIAIIDTPSDLAAHVSEADRRMAEFERMMEAARLRFCEMLELFPSECPEFTIEHDR